MKKYLFILLLALTLAPNAAQAETLTCVRGEGLQVGLPPLVVSDPRGADAVKVSDYIRVCSANGGSVPDLPSTPVSRPASSQADCGANEIFFPNNSDMGGGGGVCQPTTPTSPSSPSSPSSPTQSPNTGGGTTGTGFTSTGSGAGSTPINTFCKEGKCTYVPLEPLPGVPQNANADLPSLLAGFFKLLITFGGLFAVVMLTVAGIGYMLSETPVKLDAAKARAKAALWGLLLLSMCWLILNTINPKLLQFNLFEQSLRVIAPTANTPGRQGNIEIYAPGQAAREGLVRCPSGTSGDYNSQGVIVCK